MRRAVMPAMEEQAHKFTAGTAPLSAHASAPLAEGEFRLYVEGDTLYRAMLDAIAGARVSVRLETYIFADDEVGWMFAEGLAAAARRGVDVRVHIDAAGSLFWMSDGLTKFLRENDVQVRWFHRWTWSRPFRYNRRNHRKLLVVDASYAYLGGFNIHRENSRALYGEERWRDTHVCVHGSLAADAAETFDAFWRRQRRRDPPPSSDAVSRLVTNDSLHSRRAVRTLYGEMLARARRHIYLTTPYFVPDRPTQQALAEAATRGVDVRLLVPRKTDVLVTQWAARAAYAPLLAAGVRVYEYLPRVLHAKTATADGQWATVGTANLDYRSLFLNYEVALVTREPALVDALERQFHEDVQESEAIEPDSWRRRRWNERLLELVGWAARRWL